MRKTSLLYSLFATASALVNVTVGPGQPCVFTPRSMTVPVGETIEFSSTFGPMSLRTFTVDLAGEDFAVGTEIQYPVNNTEPVLIGARSINDAENLSLAYFTLNLASATDIYGPMIIYTWPNGNCTTQPGSVVWTNYFASTNFGLNESLSSSKEHSFRLSRPLQGQEQLDISNASCSEFIESYYAWNGSTECHTSPAFDCWRLWINPGIAEN